MDKLSLGTNSCSESGYIALYATTIISLTLAVMALAFVFKLQDSRRRQQEQELKIQAHLLAAGCAAKALVFYAFNSAYGPGQSIEIEGRSCNITTVATGPGTVTLTTSIQLGSVLLTLHTVAETQKFSIINQFEINQ